MDCHYVPVSRWSTAKNDIRLHVDSSFPYCSGGTTPAVLDNLGKNNVVVGVAVRGSR